MYNPEMRKDCPMRGNLGNCYPVGGFCMDAVSDEICEAVHNAYQHGYCDGLAMPKDQEPKPVELHTNAYGTKFYFCPKCKRELFYTRNLNFCERCGQALKWKE